MKKIDRVQGYKDLLKIDGTFFVNEDDASYQEALRRRKKEDDRKMLEERVDRLEDNISKILQILQAKGS